MTRRGTSQLRRTKRRLSASLTASPTNILTLSAATASADPPRHPLRHRDVIHHVTRPVTAAVKCEKIGQNSITDYH